MATQEQDRPAPRPPSRSRPRARGGPLQARDATRHDGVFWRRLAYAGAVHFPEWWRRYTPAFFGAAAWALVRERRRAAAENWLELGLVDSRVAAELGALRTYLAFAESLTDSLEIAGRGLDAYRLSIQAPNPLTQAIALGRGVVVVTAHTGSWEVNGRMIGHVHGVGVTMVMAREANATAREFAERVRAMGDIDLDVAYVGEDPLDALALVGALRRKRVVALQLDRVPPGMAALRVPFFGRPRAFPLGPFRLAQLTGAPLVVAFTHRVGYRRYQVEMPAGVIEIPRARRGADDQLLPHVARVAAVFEDFVRRNPEQWFHFEPVFDERP